MDKTSDENELMHDKSQCIDNQLLTMSSSLCFSPSLLFLSLSIARKTLSLSLSFSLSSSLASLPLIPFPLSLSLSLSLSFPPALYLSNLSI